jgi:hypothetical protein
MSTLAIRLLRIALVLLLLGSLLAQALIPAVASEAARVFAEVGYLVVPYSIAGILVIGCGQVALLAVWRLLSMISGEVIFTRRSLRLVDLIAACGAVATVINAGVWTHLLLVHGGGPGVLLWLSGSLVGGVAFVLLMIVMRGLLESAIGYRAELDEVI